MKIKKVSFNRARANTYTLFFIRAVPTRTAGRDSAGRTIEEQWTHCLRTIEP